MNNLSEFVKAPRNEINLTQEEFTEREGVALTVVQKIEQGKNKFEHGQGQSNTQYVWAHPCCCANKSSRA